MERERFLDVIDEIWDGKEESIPWKDLNESSRQLQFIQNLLEDRRTMFSFFDQNRLGKKGGIFAKDFKINIKILNNKDVSPALKKYIGFNDHWIVIYFGISPELENFVSIVLWPDQSQTSRGLYQAITNVINEEHKAIEILSPNVQLPNEIHPQQMRQIDITEDSKLFFNWRYFPFIKDMGDTLSRPLSPITYRKVLLRDRTNHIFADYITIRMIIGSIIDKKGSEIKVKVPFLKDRPHSYIFKLDSNIEVESFPNGEILNFLLLERAGEKIHEVFEADKAEPVDALAHILAFELYQMFIMRVSPGKYRGYINMIRHPFIKNVLSIKEMEEFRICSYDDYKKMVIDFKRLIYQKIFFQLEEQGMLSTKIDLADFIFKTYLSPYFKIDIDNNIYYLPLSLSRNPNYNNYLSEKFLKINNLIRKETYSQ